MPLKVLIVDDSSFFRKRLKEIIEADPTLTVCGEACDGKQGVEQVLKLHPDVVTMDVEMPVMDGITAVKEIMSKSPVPILMFSSLTFEGANSTFKALEAGAIDFMPKNFGDIAHRKEDALNALRSSIKAVARSRFSIRRPSISRVSQATGASVSSGTSSLTSRTSLSKASTGSSLRTATASRVQSSASLTSRETPTLAIAKEGGVLGQYKKISEMLSRDQGVPASARKFTFGDHKNETTSFKRSGKLHSVLAIGSSTGGPIALQTLIPKLPKLNVPVVIVQHMPASFTKTFAQRLDSMSTLHVVEATDGELLEPNTVYIAPGGMQMIFERLGTRARVRIIKDTGRVAYNPCVDVSFASLASIYGGRVLAMILTGMGSDGCEGCRILKEKGSVIWAQNEETCVVYGMPQAIVNARLADLVLPLNDFASCIAKEF